jgi:hypothetical protein
MASKTQWEHLLEDSGVMEPGEIPMKIDIDARFEGTVEQFVAWVNETFKNPNDMRVRAVIGNASRPMPGPRLSPIEVPNVIGKPARQLVQTYGIREDEAEQLVHEIRSFKGDKIGAMKFLREKIAVMGAKMTMGLKEAKEFVYDLPAESLKPTPDDEIPF